MMTMNLTHFRLRETCTYPNGGRTEYYIHEGTALIVDYDICRCGQKEEAFPYSLITEKQNHYMKLCERVYRFLDTDLDAAVGFFGVEQSDAGSGDTDVQSLPESTDDSPQSLAEQFWEQADISLHTADRADNADASPLELLFEKNFASVYGSDSLKYLNKEFCISDFQGGSFFLDYLIRTPKGDVAVEENGVTYHHPQIIGMERYRRQLYKQNLCARWGIKLYRFSTEDCRFEERIEDNIRSFLGSSCEGFAPNGLVVDRGFALYEHQENCLEEIAKARAEGKTTFLVVLPTASGKSKIVEEDIRTFAPENFRVLILAPNKAITDDWELRAAEALQEYRDGMEIRTFSYMARHYAKLDSRHYDYIVIDEAHHAVAPVLKRVIQHFEPRFMIGITATDQRPDRKKLESVFGAYKTQLSLEEAMETGIVATARVFRIETNVDLSKVRINGKEYVNADLEKSVRVTSRNDLIGDVLEEYFTEGAAGKRQGIVFCVSTKHTKEMARVLKERGISAAAYSSQERHPEQIMADFKAKKIRFLCVCSMISEGWDYPELGILVMARPTLSRVLYLQQIGRGLRKTSEKSDVFILDVVDEYGAMAMPCSMHSIFHNAQYVPFAPITQRRFMRGEWIEVDGICEQVQKISEVDVMSFEEKYGDYLSTEQLAREFFVSTGTVNSWIRSGKLTPTVSMPFGSRRLYLFSPQDAEEARRALQIPVHDDSTIYDDFREFLEARDYSLSYKMPFLLALLGQVSEIGEASIEAVLDEYIGFYEDRIERGLVVDRSTCPYTAEYLKDRKAMRRSMLVNPFEKFERKRFLYYSKELGLIAFHHALWEQLTEEDFARIREQMRVDLREYYERIG